MTDTETAEYDWGGDGSDLQRPVRAHVEAALVPAAGPYPPPLDQLLTLGSALEHEEIAAQIAQLGFTEEHVPDLVRMTRDRALNTMPSDSDAGWAPIHALTALASLDVGTHAAELVPLFDIDSEWFGEDLPTILGKAGQPALGPLRQYVQDRTRWQYGRWNAGGAVEQIGKQHPELRDQAIQILSEALEHAGEDDPETNGFFLADLIHLNAVEALPVIRRAFEQDAIDESIAGDWGEVLKALGRKVDQNDPLYQRSHQRRNAKKAEMRATLPPALRAPEDPFGLAPSLRKSAGSKHKNKRKASAASRKANKKKRK
ncbi:MAG TPA: hypothetical protein VKE41_14670 [Roseiflexaceae bacterium]|nr:hypothetical protein [Roseiflexaceae bacterium]